MSVEFPCPEEQARNENYELKCKVHVKNITYEDVQSKGINGLITEEMIFLEPYPSTQRDLFYFAWLPEYEQDFETKKIIPGHTEVVCRAGHPINGFFRCSVHRIDERFNNSHYLFVMSKGAEEDLKAMRDKDIVLTVLNQNLDEKADYAKDFNLSGKSIMDTDTAKSALGFSENV